MRTDAERATLRGLDIEVEREDNKVSKFRRRRRAAHHRRLGAAGRTPIGVGFNEDGPARGLRLRERFMRERTKLSCIRRTHHDRRRDHRSQPFKRAHPRPFRGYHGICSWLRDTRLEVTLLRLTGARRNRCACRREDEVGICVPISVIIPVLNAAHTLPAAIASVACADEIIVVDGGSNDESVPLAQAAGARVIVAERGRGTQLAAGARAARNLWRLFLHADTQLAPGWAPLARGFCTSGAERAATFRFALDDRSWQARALEQAVDWRTRWLGLPYGDQGLLIHRDLYEALGGFSPIPIMEDIDIVRRIGRQRLVQLDHRAVTSAVRWRTRGWLAQSLRNQFCLALYFAGVAPARIRQIYES